MGLELWVLWGLVKLGGRGAVVYSFEEMKECKGQDLSAPAWWGREQGRGWQGPGT